MLYIKCYLTTNARPPPPPTPICLHTHGAMLILNTDGDAADVSPSHRPSLAACRCSWVHTVCYLDYLEITGWWFMCARKARLHKKITPPSALGFVCVESVDTFHRFTKESDCWGQRPFLRGKQRLKSVHSFNFKINVDFFYSAVPCALGQSHNALLILRDKVVSSDSCLLKSKACLT